MATVTLATIFDSIVKRFAPRIQNQINRACVASRLLPKFQGQGQVMQWDVRFGTALGSTIADGADVSTFNNDTKIPALLQYGTYHDAFAVTGKALAGARAAGNPEQLAGLFADELMDSVQRLAKKLNQDLWSAAGGANEMVGLLAASGGLDSTGVYAGIDRATYSQWACNVLANAGVPRALSLALMREMRTTIFNESGEKPDLILCSPEIHEAYGNLLGTERRYVQEVKLRGDVIKLDGGYSVLEFDGIPVVMDSDCPAGKMVFINSQYVGISQMEDQADSVNRAMSLMSIKGTAEEQYGESSTGFVCRVQPLAKSGDAHKFALFIFPQVCVKRPNACGVIEDLS